MTPQAWWSALPRWSQPGYRFAPAGDQDFLPGLGATDILGELGIELIHANRVLQAGKVIRIGKVESDSALGYGNGAGGIRTLGLPDAIRTLCQLSYSPAKLVIRRPV